MLAVDGPSSARLHNVLGGGWNCTEADRAKAAELEAICPMIRQMQADSRLFTARTATWAAGQGIRQFIDLGAGLPPGEAVHQMARAVVPSARVAYVDNDPEVTDHLADVVLDGGQEGIAVVNADLRHPAEVLTDPGLLKVIDPDQPVLVILALVLHFTPSVPAAAIVREYARRLAPGSLIAVSTPWVGDPGMWEQLRPVNPDFAWNHGRGDLKRFLGRLEAIPPGIAPAAYLRPGWRDMPRKSRGSAYVLAGIGRKP